jgi:hypothetical protein
MSEQLPPTTPTDPVPYDTPPAKSDMGWAGVVSLICGIISLPGGCCCLIGWPASVAGVIFGFLGLKSSKGNLAKIGIILSIVGLVISIILYILSFFFNLAIPGVRGSH